MSKVFNKAVADAKSATTAKKVRNNAADQLAAAAERETEKPITSRDVWRNYQAAHNEEIAEKCVNKETFARCYSFAEAKHATADFTRVFTTSEAEDKVTKFAVINGTPYGYKTIVPMLVDDVLRSFESYQMIAEATRKQNAKAKKAEENKAKLEKYAADYGLPLAAVEKMAKDGILKF